MNGEIEREHDLDILKECCFSNGSQDVEEVKGEPAQRKG